MVDKPHIAVSWHSATRGWIYIGYRDASGRLVVRRSQNGGISFSSPYVISSINKENHKINGLQLLVSPFSGYVYAFWSDYLDDHIYWSRSLNHGVAWTGRTIFPNLTTPSQHLMNMGKLKSIVRAPSLPIARFNWAAGRISVVWHECSKKPNPDCIGNGFQADAYYASLGSGGGTNKVRINDDFGLNDQFMPALDFNGSGDVLVTFYDRRDDPNNVDYRLYSASLNASGIPYSPNQVVSLFSSTPIPFLTGKLPFLGDYHETWMSQINGVDTWYSSWIGEENNHSDVFLSAIHP